MEGVKLGFYQLPNIHVHRLLWAKYGDAKPINHKQQDYLTTRIASVIVTIWLRVSVYVQSTTTHLPFGG